MPHVETPQSLCRFAFARADITPPEGIYHRMWGAATHDRAAGIHRPLTASVLLLQSSDSAADQATDCQIVIALDHCLLGAEEVDALLDQAASSAKLPRDALLVVFSHTHAAGLMSSDRVSMPGGDLIPAYLQQVNQRVAALVSQVLQNRRAATISYGTARCNLAANRDYWDEQRGQFVCGFNPQQPADDTVLVARVTAENGQLLATVVNYACHPTTLAWDNRLVSPDFPGAMRELVERESGAPCVFIQGASGDLGPREGFVGDVRVADRNGRQLAYAVLSTLESLPPAKTRFEYQGPVISGATIGTWTHAALAPQRLQQLARWRRLRWTCPLDYRPDLPGVEETEAERRRWQADEETARGQGAEAAARDCRAMVERKTRLIARLKTLPQGTSYPFQVVAWQMGDAVWLSVQGEPYSQLQTVLRERFAQTPMMIATVSNGWGPSYLPPAEVYHKGIYQESIAVLAPGSLEQLIDNVARQLDSWLRTE